MRSSRLLLCFQKKILTGNFNRKFLSAIVISLNVILLTITQYEELCVHNNRRHEEISTKRGQKKYNEYRENNHSEDFLWRKEMELLNLALPAAETYQIKEPKTKKMNSFKFQNNLASSIIETDNPKENLNSEIIQALYNVYQKDVSRNNMAKTIENAIKENYILNCEQFSYLETNNKVPTLTYFDKKQTNKRGKLKIDGNTIVSVASKVFKSDLEIGNTPGVVKEKENILKLITMHGIPEVPRLFAVCLSVYPRKDAVLENITSGTIVFRYLIEDTTDSSPLCSFARRVLHCFTNPVPHTDGSHQTVKLIKIMKNLSVMFERFWIKGVFPFKFSLDELIVTKDDKIMFNNVQSFLFIDDVNSASHTRFLADTICKVNKDCPYSDFEGDDLLSFMLDSCNDITGHCDSTNRCWGLDANLYLCIFSNLFINQASPKLSISVMQQRNFRKTMKLAHDSSPEKRSNWTQFRSGMDEILKSALSLMKMNKL